LDFRDVDEKDNSWSVFHGKPVAKTIQQTTTQAVGRGLSKERAKP
jgi:hypothetical protein